MLLGLRAFEAEGFKGFKGFRGLGVYWMRAEGLIGLGTLGVEGFRAGGLRDCGD